MTGCDKKTSTIKDSVLAVVGVLILSSLLSEIDTFEFLMEFTRSHEKWELDEFIVSVLISPLFLCWYALRRSAELRQEVSLRKAREQDLLKLQKELSYQATHDVLTGLPNRILLKDRLDQAMKQMNRCKKALAVVYIDLDGFKAVNDSYGHNAGDDLLVRVAERMNNILRSSDTVARIGGDEFICIFPNLDNEENIIPVIERMLNRVAQPVQLNDVQVTVTASMGVTFYSTFSNVSADQLIRRADFSLYQAKQQGKNGYFLFDRSIEKEDRENRETRGYCAASCEL